MADHRLSDGAADVTAPITAAYLDALRMSMPGPRLQLARVLEELGDGLDEAVRRNLRAGMAPGRAVDTAVAQFGSPEAVAGAFAGELGTGYARRTIAVYVCSGPLVGISWLLLLHPPRQAGIVALLAAIPVLPLIAVALATAGVTLAGTGRLMRWAPEADAARALAAAIAVVALSVAGDLTMLAFLLASGRPPTALAAVAAGGSAIRIACSAIVIPRAAGLRRSL